MTRLRVLAEGDTEEDFINEVLRGHLASKGVQTTATGIGVARSSRGIVGWASAVRDIRAQLKSDPSCYLTTFVDYYALPQSWPGRVEAAARTYDTRAALIGERIIQALESKLGHIWRPDRFIPFVMIHEFETLIFSDPAASAQAWGYAKVEQAITRVRSGFPSPEAINDSKETAPSKQLEQIFSQLGLPAYDKRLHGNIAALEIGIDRLRSECPQFGDWINRLEALGKLS